MFTTTPAAGTAPAPTAKNAKVEFTDEAIIDLASKGLDDLALTHVPHETLLELTHDASDHTCMARHVVSRLTLEQIFSMVRTKGISQWANVGTIIDELVQQVADCIEHWDD